MRPSTLLDRLLRGRSWVALIAVLLTGIVFLNVSLLEINGSIARMDARAAELKRDNADLRMRVARLGSSERIRQAAAAQGFVGAPPGDVGYLLARPDDASAAARALEDWRPPAPATPRDPSTTAQAQGTTAGAWSDESTAGSSAGAAATSTPSSGAATSPAGDSSAAEGAGASPAGVGADSAAAQTPGTDAQTGGATP